ncbi:YrhK family protein [Kushneria aurantia]|uniref:YrhK family protein n=1 Tax=Kushneria aurantia TaxID=504092 RepID=A0ABV6G6U4_9GAMM|nr:YrhK family protein [Kushneria aurantia]
MPHMVASRRRMYSPTSSADDRNAHSRWETFNARTYMLGGLGFILASVLFLPSLSAFHALAAWLFFAASLCYLLVTTHDLYETLRYWYHHHHLGLSGVGELVAVTSYFVASVLFALGSLYFLPGWGWDALGAWCFIIGSVLFLVGAFLNLPQLVKSPTGISMVLFNLTLVTFLIGSTLFLVATIPYLMHFDSQHTSDEVFRLAVGQFIAASILFLFGGIFMFWRLYMMNALPAAVRPNRLSRWLLNKLALDIEQQND